jgi:hypothetical protein
MRVVSEIKTREYDFYRAPEAEFPGYVAMVGAVAVGRFRRAADAAWAAARADFEKNAGERGGAFVKFEGDPRPAGAPKPGRLIRVCYRTREKKAELCSSSQTG